MTQPHDNLITSDIPPPTQELSPEALEIRKELMKCNENYLAIKNYLQENKDKELTTDDLKDVLGLTIKHDNTNKLITFLCMVLTYTEEDQVNIANLAESSTGKSYIPLQLIPFFPESDVIPLGYVSPTAFFHDWGIPLTDPKDTNPDFEKRRKIIHVDLEKKILLFLDQPHEQLLKNLRPLLSHDQKHIEVRISNQSQKSGYRTKRAILDGFPTILFCSAKTKMDEQEATRLFLLSPEINQEKIKEGIILKLQKEGDREKFQEMLDSDPKRAFLIERIKDIKSQDIKQVKIPDELLAQINQHFLEDREHLLPRHMRDITKVTAIMKGHALLNYMHREQQRDKAAKEIILSININENDMLIGFSLYKDVSTANELGLPPRDYDEYKQLENEFLEPGLTNSGFQKIYHKKFFKLLGRDNAKRKLELWVNVGLLQEYQDPLDKRKIRYMREGVGCEGEGY
ncbi:MAG: hypothetical protein IAX22_04785 [Candidatus Bathyarchaeota archaeon]|nr:hypothetical protein [Candidatus Bathyarchaeota archaeon]